MEPPLQLAPPLLAGSLPRANTLLHALHTLLWQGRTRTLSGVFADSRLNALERVQQVMVFSTTKSANVPHQLPRVFDART